MGNRAKLKKWCWLVLVLRTAEWQIPKVATGERLEGGWRLERGASLGLFPSGTVEARDRSLGPHYP